MAGAPIWIRPVAPISDWADHAPALAGLPSFTEEQAERVLERGTGPEGEETASADAHLPHETRGCESDYRLFEVAAEEFADVLVRRG
jgi:hypothetical protein